MSVGSTPPGQHGGDAAMERLDPRTVPYWVLTSIVLAGFFVALGGTGLRFLLDKYPEQESWAVPAGVGLGCVLLVAAVVQPVLTYVFWRFGIDARLLTAHFGILFRTEKVIPVSRMQHVDLTRGPIERLFGLATFVVFTAGTEDASFRVAGLSVQRARAMRDLVLAARGDDAI